MADLKKYITEPGLVFEGFFRQVSSYSVFQNKSEFKVKVLTNPIPYTGPDPDIETGDSPSDQKSQKYWFKGRILDPNMAHEKFLPDPCDNTIAADPEYAQALTSLHATIFAETEPDCSIGDIILAFAGPGDNNKIYNLQHMKWIKTETKNLGGLVIGQECFKLSKYDWASTGFNFSEEEYNIDDITFESITQPLAADRALLYHQQIGKSGVNESNKKNRTKIVDTIHVPTYAAYRGAPMPDNMRQEYIDNLKERAWSAWFLNSCYIDRGTPGFLEFQKNALKFEDSGCCYPSPYAANNRREVFNNPEKYIGKTVLLIFSNTEIESKPVELGLVYGDASIVGQENVYKPWEETRNEFENKSGVTHLNVYVGDKSIESGKNFIGGNLGNSTDYRNDLDKFGFLKLVKIVSVDK